MSSIEYSYQEIRGSNPRQEIIFRVFLPVGPMVRRLTTGFCFYHVDFLSECSGASQPGLRALKGGVPVPARAEERAALCTCQLSFKLVLQLC